MTETHITTRSDVLAEGCFNDVGTAFAEGYNAYEVILYPVAATGLPMQRCPFYAVSDIAAKDHCCKVYASLRFHLYRLTLLDMSGKTDGS